jgi:hypothetical protein
VVIRLTGQADREAERERKKEREKERDAPFAEVAGLVVGVDPKCLVSVLQSLGEELQLQMGRAATGIQGRKVVQSNCGRVVFLRDIN